MTLPITIFAAACVLAVSNAPPAPAVATAATIRVMTLNAAHGRGDGWHQLLQRSRRHVANLDRIGEMLRRERPAVVALQEIDGVSLWNGNFHHLRYLAAAGGYEHYALGKLVNRGRLSHGVGLLSTQSLDDPAVVRFQPAPGDTAKGYVIAAIEWPGCSNIVVDVVSVHLEAFRGRLRERQVDELVERIGKRDRPLILMGDFNSSWFGGRDQVRTLAGKLGLNAYRPQSDGFATLPILNRRIDWILISKHFEFRSYRTLDDIVSDHRAVIADIALRDCER